MTPEWKVTNGGAPAKSTIESEVTSDQEEGGNVNSKMLNKPETPKSEAKNGKKASLTPSLNAGENRRTSRQLRLDSEAPLMDNTVSDDECDAHLENGLMDSMANTNGMSGYDGNVNLGNGHLEGDKIIDMPGEQDDAFGDGLEVCAIGDASVDACALNNKPETPKSDAKYGKKASLTPSTNPDENRRTSRQLRLDSEAPLMDNTDVMSDDDCNVNLEIGGREDDKIVDISGEQDNTFGDANLQDVCLEDSEEAARTNNGLN